LMKQQNNDNSPTRLLGIPLSDAIVIAAASVAAYVFAFAYQAGYCDAFGIPREIIALSVSDVLGAGAKIILVFSAILGLINVLSSLLPSRMPYPLQRRISQALPALIFFVATGWFYDWQGSSVIFVFAAAAFVLAVMFLPPLLTRRHRGSYLQKMAELDSELSSTNPWKGSLLDRTVDAVGYKVFLVGVYLLLGVYLTYIAGKDSAARQKVFFVTNTSPEAVVLFMTSDRLISAPVDRTAKLIEPVFMIVNFAGKPELKLQSVELGPLKLRRPTSAQPKASGGPMKAPLRPFRPTPKGTEPEAAAPKSPEPEAALKKFRSSLAQPVWNRSGRSLIGSSVGADVRSDTGSR
jgi:hypothetical protein